MSDDRKPVPFGGGELQTSGGGGEGAISTELRNVDADSPAFLATVSSCLPADVSETVVEFHTSARNRYRRFEILLILLALCGVGWFVYLYFPKPIPAPPFQFTWQYRGPLFPGDSPWLESYRQASGEFDREHYETALRILKKSIDEMGENLPAGHDALFYLYFVSCENGAAGPEVWRGGVSLARRLVGQEPDNLMWHYFLVLSQRECFPGCAECYQALKEGSWKDNWQWKLLETNQALKNLQTLESKIQKRLTPLPQEKEILKQLALFQAELLTLKWMLQGGEGTAEFDDDANDPGVSSREEAWRIIDEMEEQPFVKLKILILEILLEQDSQFNSIYWNGKSRGTKTPLTERLQQEMRVLKGGVR